MINTSKDIKANETDNVSR